MQKYYLLGLAFIACRCASKLPQPDAYGNFEAEEILVSSESSGKLISFTAEKGDTLEAGAIIGILDTVELISKKQRLQAHLDTLLTRWLGAYPSLAALMEQKRNAQKRKQEIAAPNRAASAKELESVTLKIKAIENEINERAQALALSHPALEAQIQPIFLQIQELEALKQKRFIRSPLKGSILATFARLGETVAPGKPIVKIASLNPLVLRAYISGAQLPQVYLGQMVNIGINSKIAQEENLIGKVHWIASQAEFANVKDKQRQLAYAFKVLVPNREGKLKVGMPAEVWFIPSSPPTKNTMAE
jgi:HlyD family secretion protein